MKNNKQSFKSGGSQVLTRKTKAWNGGKASPAVHNGREEKSIVKKVKKEKNVQKSESSSEISEYTNNSENFNPQLE